MNQFNLGQFLTKVIDYSLSGMRGNSTEAAPRPPTAPSQESFSQNMVPKQQVNAQPKVVVNTVVFQAMPMQNIQTMQMNHLESLEKALYAKELMNLPKDMQDFLKMMQKNLDNPAELQVLLKNNINMDQLAILLQQNGKEAVNKLIMAMANASKQGITDLSQIKETMKLINASVSTAGQNNPNQTLKSLMMLYLPWLPVPPDVDFELEIGSDEEKSGDSESSITIMISTKKYGNVKATLVLTAGKSLTILINCSNEFPKEELLKRLKAESTSHSVQSDILFEQKATKQNENITRQAKINMSNTSEVSPFLLLMAHSVIRHTIELDKEKG